MRLFDAYLCVDWSARSAPSPPRPAADALWLAEAPPPRARGREYFRTRDLCCAYLRERLVDHRRHGRRVLVGVDFPLGYPAGSAAALGLASGAPPWRRLWDELARRIHDDAANGNNRFAVAAELNARCGGRGPGPFWGCPPGAVSPTLRRTRPRFRRRQDATRLARAGLRLARLRRVDRELRVQEVWKLFGIGSVGGQALLGIPRVRSLRDDPALGDTSRVWPFETGFTTRPVAPRGPSALFVEVWPGLVEARRDRRLIRDRAQVRAVVEWAAELDGRGELARWFAPPEGLRAGELARCVREEGWILGCAPRRPPR